ncbi:MAG: class I tRNA ligase family protein, partial [Desulfovibrio sp.]|nr:class I tRNA ligase family protein [Desulfovibrio sp.]
DQSLKDYRFSDAAMTGYRFLWNDFCDWFLELSKQDLASADETVKGCAQYVLWLVLGETLLILYPVMPFVTAEIWSRLQPDGDIAKAQWPPYRPGCVRPALAAQMEFVKNVIIATRTIKAELGISPARKVNLILHPVDAGQRELLAANQESISRLARLESLLIDAGAEAPKAAAAQVVEGCQVIVPLGGLVNLEDEVARLNKEIARLDKELAAVDGKLNNESFVSRAPEAVVAREKERADKLFDARNKLLARRALFGQALDQD